jgi:hypothetical protein
MPEQPRRRDAASNTNLEVTTMKALHRLDPAEGSVRFALGAALLLIAWDYGWTVIGTGAAVLGLVSLATAILGVSMVNPLRTKPPVVAPTAAHNWHDVHDRAQEGHAIDTESL